MISKSQLQVLSYLIDEAESGVPISTLATQLEWSLGHTSRVVSELARNGLVQTREQGREKLVTPSEIEPVEKLEGLLAEYSHVDFPKLIGGTALELLYYLDQSRTATELAESSSVSRATVYRRLDDLQRVGIIGKSKSRYQLNEPFTALAQIARGLVHHRHRREAEQYTSGVTILWETPDEYLFACDSEFTADGFHQTGPALFREFEIPLLTRDRRHYFRSDRIESVPPADLVCHMLLIDAGPRYQTYCLLLIQHTDLDQATLEECVAHYATEAERDLPALIEELVAYLETGGQETTEQLPAWNEFKSIAADYEITV